MSARTTFIPSTANRSPSARPMPPAPPVMTATLPGRSCIRRGSVPVMGRVAFVDDRYIVISADCHAGADMRDYKPYLESRYHDEFDHWADNYVNPFGDLVRPEADRSWDSAKRVRQLEEDGV